MSFLSKGSSTNDSKVKQWVLNCVLSKHIFTCSTLKNFHQVKYIPFLPMVEKYVDDVISRVKKIQVETYSNHLNTGELYMKFNMESAGSDESILFLNGKSLLNEDHSMQMSVYRKPTHTDCYLDCNSNHPTALFIVDVEATQDLIDG